MLLAAAMCQAAPFQVDQIDLEGNIRTRPVIILQELPFSVGDSVDEETLEEGRQAVMDLGIFESVELFTLVNEFDKNVMLIRVKEKQYNFILPKLNRNGDGDITTGIVWRSDNLFGLNQESEITVAYKQFEDASEEDETELAWKYTYPRIANTPYSLDFVALNEVTNLEQTVGSRSGEYEETRNLLQVLVGKWLNKTGPSRGLNLQAGPFYESYENTYLSGTPGLVPDVTIHAIATRLDGYYVHDNLLNRTGHHFGYELIVSDDALGSEKNYIQQFFFFRTYLPVPGIDYQNLNMQFRLGSISQSVLGPPQFSIGGSRGVRGYSREAIEGNVYSIVNIEYLRPLFKRDAIRGVLFTDIGNAWDETDEVSFSNFKYGAGVGLRWTLKKFVRTELRLDIAHGFSEGGETKAYLSTQATF